MLMSPKVVCQQSFFTSAPNTSALFELLRGLLYLVLGPALKRIMPGATHHLDDLHFRSIRSLELAALIFDGQNQGLNSTSQIRICTQSPYQFCVTHQ